MLFVILKQFKSAYPGEKQLSFQMIYIIFSIHPDQKC